MPRRVCLIDLPGLSRELLQHVPASSRLGKWMQSQQISTLLPPWPAVTCTVQATLTTGATPSQHGIVSNGLATFRSPEDQALVDASSFADFRRDVSFWEQSNQLVQMPRFWQDSSGKSRYKTAMLFFQNSMPGFAGTPKPAADIVITPKPEHGPDGKITSLLWTEPRDLVPQLFEKFGPFPLMNYWGPLAGIASSQWIANAAAWVWKNLQPQLQLTYVPHLDYDLQRFGPNSEQAAKAVADVSVALEPLLDVVLPEGELVVLSEYSMQPVKRCIQINLLLAESGLLLTHDSPDGRLVDFGRSDAFALVDHQIAHVYIRHRALREVVSDVVLNLPLRELPESCRIQHRRAGDIQLEAELDAWFDYRWWSRDADAPRFATTVDIHRKPGYDPLELFFDPASKSISQNAALVRGSHGRAGTSPGVLIEGGRVHMEKPIVAMDFARMIERLME